MTIVAEVVVGMYEFLDSKFRNKYVYDSNNIVQLYTRKGHHAIGNSVVNTLDIASLVIEEDYRGMKIGRRVINEIHRINPFGYTYIESLLNTSLYYHLIENGWIDVPRSTPPCVYKRTNNTNEHTMCQLLDSTRPSQIQRDSVRSM